MALNLMPARKTGRASFIKIDNFVKSHPEAMFVNYHEGHEEHEGWNLMSFRIE
jgi:hypothetical protein